MRQYPVLVILLTLAACGAPQAPQEDDHPWKSGTDIIDQAKDIEGMIDDSSARQRRQIDLQTQ